MPATEPNAVTLLHRLLFRALLEVRSGAREQKDKVAYHLADLFHTVVLEMENAAEGRGTYEAALKALQERADEKGLSEWLRRNVADLNR
jgi:hypothetical protein